MTKFSTMLSANDALQRRAKQLEESAKLAQQAIINDLKNQKAQLNLQIAAHLDLAPDSTTSTQPGTKDWDARTWAVELQRFKEQLYSLDIAIGIAEKTFNEFFVEQ